MAITMTWADSESLYVYRNDGDFNYFVTDRLDSVVYSDIDMTGKKCAEPVVQEFWVSGKATRIPLTAIDSIRFVDPELNTMLIDPVRYQYPSEDATINPNILMDYMDNTQLVSIDTTSWMANVHFADKVPTLYKGCILVLKHEDSHVALRVLEAYQNGQDAELHVIPVGPQELIFNTTLTFGKSDDDPATAPSRADSSDDDLWVNFCKTDLNFKKDWGFDLGIDKFDWNTKLYFKMKITKPSFSLKNGFTEGRIDDFHFELKGNFIADCHLSFSPKGELTLKTSWDWTPKPIPFKLKAMVGYLPVVVNIDVDLAAEIEAKLKAGLFTWYQPFTVSSKAQVGVDYNYATGAKPLNHFDFKFERKEPSLEHTPEMKITTDMALVYPKFDVYFYGCKWVGFNVTVKPTLEYEAESLVWEGQEHFQHKLSAKVGVSGDLHETLTQDKPRKLFELKGKFGPWKIWSEPQKLIKIDSLKNVFLYNKSKTKQPVQVLATKIDQVSTDQPAPKPEPTPLKNPVKVEIRTKAAIVNPKDENATMSLLNPMLGTNAVDEKGYYDWANEYQEVDTVTSTFQPIYEGYTPAGIETKQLIKITDPTTGEVIDSTEIVPITAIKSYDISMTQHEDEEGLYHQTIKSNIKVRDFGADTEETGIIHREEKCAICGSWHITDGTFTAQYKDGNGKVNITNERWTTDHAGNCYKETFSTESNEFKMVLGSFNMRYIPSSLPYTPIEKRHNLSMAESFDQIRWLIDNMGADANTSTFEEGTYRGVDCTKMIPVEGDNGATTYFWQNIVLGQSSVESARTTTLDTDELIIYPDTIPGQPKGDAPITVIAAGGQSVNFGDGNNPENRVYPEDKPNIPAKQEGADSGDDDGDGDGGGYGDQEWIANWTPGIYEMVDPEAGSTLMLAISTDGWTYLIVNTNDYEGENLVTFDDVNYNYDGYTFHMPCGFKWCDNGTTVYYYVENPSTGNGETKAVKFASRDEMFGYSEYTCIDIKMLATMLPPQFMKRVADAGTHQETYDAIVKRYRK